MIKMITHTAFLKKRFQKGLYIVVLQAKYKNILIEWTKRCGQYGFCKLQTDLEVSQNASQLGRHTVEFALAGHRMASYTSCGASYTNRFPLYTHYRVKKFFKFFKDVSVCALLHVRYIKSGVCRFCTTTVNQPNYKYKICFQTTFANASANSSITNIALMGLKVQAYLNR